MQYGLSFNVVIVRTIVVIFTRLIAINSFIAYSKRQLVEAKSLSF
jgi:hypothetical protein